MNVNLAANIFWSGMDKLSMQLLQLITTVIIARLIAPSEYGLIALTTVFLALAQIFVDSGFCVAIIQKNVLDVKVYSSVYYFNLLISVIIYVLLYFLALAIADFYNEPLLSLILRVVGLNIIISAFSYVQKAYLSITYRLKIQAKITFGAMLLGSTIGITMAFNGFGVWALVVQTLLTNFCSCVLLCVFSGWRPVWAFSFLSLKELFSFGSKIFLSSLTQVVFVNSYSIVIGKIYDASVLGCFNRVQTILNLLSDNIMNILNRPVFVYLCQNRNDMSVAKKNFESYLRFSSFIIFPIMVGGFVLSESFILTVLTSEWIRAVPIFRILTVAFLFIPITFVNSNMLKVLGYSSLYLKLTILQRSIGVVVLLLTIKFSLYVLCCGVVLSYFFDSLVAILILKRVFDTSIYRQIKLLFPVLCTSLLMGMFICIVIGSIDSVCLKFFIGIIIGIFSYTVLSILFNVNEVKKILLFAKRR